MAELGAVVLGGCRHKARRRLGAADGKPGATMGKTLALGGPGFASRVGAGQGGGSVVRLYCRVSPLGRTCHQVSWVAR
jgi:hypothetical protein